MVLSFYIQVDVYMAITSIINFDMMTGKLLCSGYMFASWTDEQLVWNSTDYNGISRLNVQSADIWTPQFVQSHRQKMDISLSPVWAYNNGTIIWLIGSIFEGDCQLDMWAYPMDTQTCMFTMQISSDNSGIEIKVISHGSGQLKFSQHGEWEVKDVSTEAFVFTEPINGINYTTLSKTYKLTRRYLFIMIHQGVPIFLLGFLNVIIFLVPLKSGERITFSMTVLLTFVVFTSNISDELPHNSLNMPLLSIEMAIFNCISTLAVISSVILCRLAHETIVPVPNFLVCPTRRFVEYKRHKFRKRIEKETADKVVPLNDEHKTHEDLTKQLDHSEVEEKIDITWEKVAEMLDVILFYTNFLGAFVVGIIIGGLILFG